MGYISSLIEFSLLLLLFIQHFCCHCCYYLYYLLFILQKCKQATTAMYRQIQLDSQIDNQFSSTVIKLLSSSDYERFLKATVINKYVSRGRICRHMYCKLLICCAQELLILSEVAWHAFTSAVVQLKITAWILQPRAKACLPCPPNSVAFVTLVVDRDCASGVSHL